MLAQPQPRQDLFVQQPVEHDPRRITVVYDRPPAAEPAPAPAPPPAPPRQPEITRPRFEFHGDIGGITHVPERERALVHEVVAKGFVAKCPHENWDQMDYDRPSNISVEMTPESHRVFFYGFNEPISDRDLARIKYTLAHAQPPIELASLSCDAMNLPSSPYTERVLTLIIEVKRPAIIAAQKAELSAIESTAPGSAQRKRRFLGLF